MKKHQFSFYAKKVHQSTGINAILFVVVLLGILTCVTMDSLSATQESQRMKSYGSWHAALYESVDEITKQISDNAMIDSVGIMYVCGEICDSDKLTGCAIGYVNQELLTMGNIELLDGRMPETSNEIALEASTLSKLGYSYELGQTISLQILSNKSNDYQYDSFLLCGVIKNYTGNWKCGYNNLVSGFIYPNNQAEYHHAFIKLSDMYAKFVDDLNRICQHQLVLNDYTYTMYSSDTSDDIDTKMLQIVLLFAGFSILLLFINNEIIKRQPDYIILRLLGSTRGSILMMFFREKICKFLLMILLGTVVGIFTAFIFFSLFFRKGGVFDIEVTHIILTVLLNLLGIVVAFIFSFIRLFQIPLRGKAQQQKRKSKKVFGKLIDVKSIFVRFRKSDRGSYLLSLSLSVIATSFICISLYKTWDLFSEYRYYSREYPIDYTYGLLASYSRLENLESEDTIKRIESAYGVEKVYGYSISDYQPITFENGYDYEYASYVKDEINAYFRLTEDNDFPVDSGPYGTIVGISDELSSFYLSLAHNKLSKSTLAEDDVIIYLPDYDTNDKVLSDNFIKEGDRLSFIYNDCAHILKVVGIIRQQEYYPFCYYIPRPYSLICTQETYDKICGKNDYSYILVKRDKKAVAYQTDAELSKIKTELFYVNNRMEKDEYKNNIYMQLSISILICASGILMLVLARYGIQMITNHYESYRYKTLYQLGMESKTIKNRLLMNAFSESFYGTLAALSVVLIWIFLRTRSNIINDSILFVQSVSVWESILQTSDQFIKYTHWIFITIMSVLSFAFNSFLLIIRSQVMIRTLEADTTFNQ